MNYRCISAADLDEGVVNRWSAIQTSIPDFASPFFRPEFVQAVGTVRSDLRVCVLEDANRVVGFFPFHQRLGGVARPVGLGLSDHHGVVVEPGAEWTASDLMRACRIARWEFDHLVAGQAQWQTFVEKVELSPLIETTRAYSYYLAGKRKSLETALRRQRKLEREIGGLRFEAKSLDPALLERVIEWKREQCRRTGTVDFFALAWTGELLRRIHATDAPDFGGSLSALWAGDRLLAAHFGMRCRHVQHYWFPVYNTAFGQYAPGLVLLLELVRQACEDGTHHIDLGKDMSQYKAKFMTGAMQVSIGKATIPGMVNCLYRVRESLEERGRESMLRPLLVLPGRVIKRVERLWRYR